MSVKETPENVLEGNTIILNRTASELAAHNLLSVLRADMVTIPPENDKIETTSSLDMATIPPENDKIEITSSLDYETFKNLINNTVNHEYNHPDNGNNHIRGRETGGISTEFGIVRYCKGQHGLEIKVTSPTLGGVSYLVRIQTPTGEEMYGLVNSAGEMSTAGGSFLILGIQNDMLKAFRLDSIQSTIDCTQVSFAEKQEAVFSSPGKASSLGTLYFADTYYYYKNDIEEKEQKNENIQGAKHYVKLTDREGNTKIGVRVGKQGHEILFEGEETSISLASIICPAVSIQAYDSKKHSASKEITPESLIVEAQQAAVPEKGTYKGRPSQLGNYLYPKDEQANLLTKKYVINGYLMELTYIEFTDKEGNKLRGFVDYVNAPSVVYIFNESNKVSFIKYPWSAIKIEN